METALVIVLVVLFLAVGVPVAIVRWATIAPPLARWINRRFPRLARALGMETAESRDPEELP